ncbi:uncharacterized protein BKA55DRAFT_541360 [Fusarium redolens]|uniref:Uncharacterized protein n=1 Tax=Fusarium redolens TaxID=48865 RepID=A0A9P9GSS0_FUSRE|nr:uncharacterized protein BKA55DRAFT_541360 [Fusarium redolens]KAH7244461.1 hypothetical protein BKA55DRAFT_541360 [Fusarium redolens]
MISLGKDKGWTCDKSSGATNQDLQNAVDDFSIAFSPNSLTVESKRCYVSVCNSHYLSLCNYGYKNSTEPVGQRVRAKEWGLPGGNGTECRGNFGDKVNYDWYEFGLISELKEYEKDPKYVEIRECEESIEGGNTSSVALSWTA